MSDYRWLEQLHKEHYATLLQLARNQLYRRIGSCADAEDIVQEAFVLAAEKDIRNHAAPLKWLMKTVTNLCKQYTQKAFRELQKQQRVIQAKTDESADRSVYAVERLDSEAGMQEAMLTLEQTLAADDWALLRDLFLQGQSSEDAARSRGISVNALHVRVCRTRKTVRKIFEGL